MKYTCSTNLESAPRSESNATILRFKTPTLPSAELRREYVRSMRAAEMAAWEMTGGDYLQSWFVKQAFAC